MKAMHSERPVDAALIAIMEPRHPTSGIHGCGAARSRLFPVPRGIRQPGSGRPRLSEEEKRARGTFSGAKEAWVERRREANLEAQREAAARSAKEADLVPPPDDDLDDFEKGW